MEEMIDLFFNRPEGHVRTGPNNVPYIDKNELGFRQHFQITLDRNRVYQQPGSSSYYTHYFIGAFLMFIQTDLKEKMGIDKVYMKIDEDNLKVVFGKKDSKEVLLYSINMEDEDPDLRFSPLELKEIIQKMSSEGYCDDFSIMHRTFSIEKPDEGETYYAYTELGFQENVASDNSPYTAMTAEESLPSNSQSIGALKTAIVYDVNANGDIPATFAEISKMPNTRIIDLIPQLTDKNFNEIKTNMKNVFTQLIDLYQHYDNVFKAVSEVKAKNLKTNDGDACLGFIHGSIEVNFKLKYDIDFVTDEFHLYLTSRLNSKSNWRFDAIPIRIAIPEIKHNFDEGAIYDELIEQRGRGPVKLPLFAYSPTKNILVAIVNFRSRFISKVAVTSLPVAQYKGAIRTFMEESQRFRDEYKAEKQSRTSEAFQNWLSISKETFEISIESSLMEDWHSSAIGKDFKRNFGGTFILGQLLATEKISDMNIKKYAFFHQTNNDLKQVTSFLLKERQYFGINVNVIETKGIKSDFPKTSVEIPSPRKYDISELLTINVRIHLHKDLRTEENPNQFSNDYFDINVEAGEISEVDEIIRKTKPFIELKSINLHNFLHVQDDQNIKIFNEEFQKNLQEILISFPGTIKSNKDMEAIMKGLFLQHAKMVAAYDDHGPAFAVIPFDKSGINDIDNRPVPMVFSTDFIENMDSMDINNFEQAKNYIQSKQSLARIDETLKIFNVIFIKNSGTGEEHVAIYSQSHPSGFVDYLNQPSTSSCDPVARKKRFAVECKFKDNVKEKSESYKNIYKEMVKSQKIVNYMSKVGSFSSKAMYAMMGKNALHSLANGDFKDVAFNVGFIAAGVGLSKLSEKVFLKGLEISEQKLILGNVLKAASPFLARLTSAFIVYDLINNVKTLNHNDTDALVGVISDSIFLATDAMEIGVALGEAFGLIEGISAITGPIGTAVGLAVMIGADIYFAVKKVNEINKIVHLHAQEKFIEGIRAALGLEPEKYIQNLIQRKQTNQEIFNQVENFLEKSEYIKTYVFPTRRVQTTCKSVYKRDEWIGVNNAGFMAPLKRTTKYEKVCDHKTIFDKNNSVYLQHKYQNFAVSRAIPSTKSSRIICLLLPDEDEMPKRSAWCYLPFINIFFAGCLNIAPFQTAKNANPCKNAIGVKTRTVKQQNYTIINLGDGTDVAYGKLRSPNVFLLESGYKQIIGGNADDKFILNNSTITGFIIGKKGINTLDLTNFLNEPSFTAVVDLIADYLRVMSNDAIVSQLYIKHINQVIGRLNKPDIIFAHCDTIQINSKGGLNQNETDKIVINDIDRCSYNMKLNVESNTLIHNQALFGNFWYFIQYGEGKMNINLLSDEKAKHYLIFEFELNQLKQARIRNISNSKHKAVFTSQNSSFIMDLEFRDKSNVLIKFNDNMELTRHRNNFIAVQNTSKHVKEIVESYYTAAQRLKILIISHSQADNATVIIGHNKYHDTHENDTQDSHAAMILYNDPHYETHFLRGNSENLFIVKPLNETPSSIEDFKIPKIIIHDLSSPLFTETIELTQFSNHLKELNYSLKFTLTVGKLKHDIIIKLFAENSPPPNNQIYLTEIVLRNVLKKNHYEHFIIVNNFPFKIRMPLENQTPYLYPVPITFKNDTNLIVLTENDVTENNTIKVEKMFGSYEYSRLHNDLVLTNALPGNEDDAEDPNTILLQNFYANEKMRSLQFKFDDQEIVLEKEKAEIDEANDFFKKLEDYYNKLWSNRRLLDFDSYWDKSRHEVAYAHMASRIRSRSNAIRNIRN